MRFIDPSKDLQGTLQRLREAIDAKAAAPRQSLAAVATGWPLVDAALSPAGGLPRGALHEWMGLDLGDTTTGRHGAWVPPLGVLVHLAAQAVKTSDVSGVLWIGHRLWPYAHALQRFDGLFARSVLIEARGDDERWWTIDAALRCPGVVVIGDASGLPMPASRRLQLAAEAGGSIALLARPPRDAAELSVAATRWRVCVKPGVVGTQRWSIRLVRSKGSQAHGDATRTWILERCGDGSVGCVPPDVVGGLRAAAAVG